MEKKPGSIYEEKTISTDTIYEGNIITVQVDQVRLPNGKTASRELVRHPGAVAVLALNGDKLVVVEQYRKALGKSQVEIPAGKLEAGEDPLEAARRELQEETGFTCGSIRHLQSFYTSPGFADELLHLYLAEDLTKGQTHPDEDEFLDMEEITLEQARQYVEDAKISDAKTLLAVYAWELYLLKGSM